MVLLSHYWGWLAIAAGLGLISALTGHHDSDTSRRPAWIFGIGALLALGAAAAFLKLLAGAPALWLETAFLSFVAFALGAIVGGKGRIGGFWWGPMIVGGLVWACSNALIGDPAAPPASPVAAAKAPDSLADKKAAAIAAAKALPESGPLSAAQCQTALAGLIASENVKFDTGSATISDGSKALIGKIGGVLGRCQDVKVEVEGHTDASGDAAANKSLSQRRAEAVADVLKTGGATAERLTAVGYGAEKPIASNDDANGRAENRRIEFVVK